MLLRSAASEHPFWSEPCKQLLTRTSTSHLAPCSALSTPQPEGLLKAASADLSLTQNLSVASYCHQDKITVCVHAFLPPHLPLRCPEPSPNLAPPPLSSLGQARPGQARPSCSFLLTRAPLLCYCPHCLLVCLLTNSKFPVASSLCLCMRLGAHGPSGRQERGVNSLSTVSWSPRVAGRS